MLVLADPTSMITLCNYAWGHNATQNRCTRPAAPLGAPGLPVDQNKPQQRVWAALGNRKAPGMAPLHLQKTPICRSARLSRSSAVWAEA